MNFNPRPFRLVYVAGPYRSDTPYNVERNIRRARDVAAAVVMAGHYPIVPHLCTAHMEGLAPDAQFLAGALEAMRRCDEVWVAPGWEYSAGTRSELAEAFALDMPVHLHNGPPLDFETFRSFVCEVARLHAVELGYIDPPTTDPEAC